MLRKRGILSFFLIFIGDMVLIAILNRSGIFNRKDASRTRVLERKAVVISTLSRVHRKSLPPVVKKFTFSKLKHKDLYIFSAYADFRLGDVVRLVGMATLNYNNQKELYCVISHRDGAEEVPAIINYLPEIHASRYAAIFVLCRSARPLANGTKVGLSNHLKKADFLIPVQTIPSTFLSPERGMTVCYPPLHTGFDDVELFVENIEMNRILGFRQFFVYVHKVGPRVRRAIDSYEKEGIVHVVSWKSFPLESGKAIHYFGQMVAINDCLYRAMNNPFRVVAFHDFDELIIPRRGLSLSKVVVKEMRFSVSGLSVRCAMFNLGFADDANLTLPSSTNSPRLLTQLKTRRLIRIFPHRNRSKMLVVADKIFTMGIHFVWLSERDPIVSLDHKTALLHHYRFWGEGTNFNVVDRTALKYRKVLMLNVKHRLRK